MFLKSFFRYIIVLFLSLLLTACGGGGSSSGLSNNTGVFIDDVVEGIFYKTNSTSGFTNDKGEFPYEKNQSIEFFIGDIKIGKIDSLPSDGKVFIHDLLKLDREDLNNTNLLKIAQFLQSLDSDKNTSKIEIKKEDFDKFKNINKDILNVDTQDLLKKRKISIKSENEVKNHLIYSFTKHNNSKFDQKEKDFLSSLFKNSYYWSDKVEDKPNSKYLSANEMIRDLRYKEVDKWSYAQTFQSYNNVSNQKSSGFGCSFKKDTIYKMDINSPCEKAGLKRGDRLVKINDEKVTNQLYVNARKNLGVEVTFTVYRKGNSIDLKITPTDYSYKASSRRIINHEGKKIAYFIYNKFTSKSSEEIEEAFTYFKNNNVEELIVDLRYNGGGSVSVASILIDKIAGLKNENKLQFYSLEKPSNNRKSYYFMKDDNSLDLSRVFFLTTSNSASASELVINSLKPYLDVKIIGSKTHGKPVGMIGKYISSNYIYWLINLSFFNVNDEGEYFDGLNYDCFANDNIYEDIGDFSNESLLSEAMYFIKNDSCR